MKNKNLELVGKEEGYQVFKNSEGFLEGYKRIGNVKLGPDQDTGKDLKRIVTNTKTFRRFREICSRIEIQEKNKRHSGKDQPTTSAI